MISCSKCKKATLPVSNGGCIKTGGIVDIGCEYGEPRTITNYDRLRAMTDEELAEYHAEKCGCPHDPIVFWVQDGNYWLHWLLARLAETGGGRVFTLRSRPTDAAGVWSL